MNANDSIREVAKLMVKSESILFITGAGISADSGLPTYRGVGGLYEGRDTDDGMPIEMALSGPVFETSPEITWKYIHQIENSCRGAHPNAAHEVIARLEAQKPRVVTLTQNVDGLHRKAGAHHVIEIHGNVFDLRCTDCEHRRSVADFSGLEPLPRCPDCSAVIRPDVVLFDEMLPEHKVKLLSSELHIGFDLVFSVGTSSLFPYITAPVIAAHREGTPTVEINPRPTEISHLVDHRLGLGAAEALAALEAAALAL